MRDMIKVLALRARTPRTWRGCSHIRKLESDTTLPSLALLPVPLRVLDNFAVLPATRTSCTRRLTRRL